MITAPELLLVFGYLPRLFSSVHRRRDRRKEIRKAVAVPDFRDPRIRAVAAHVPFLCDFRLAARTPRSLVNQLLEKAGALKPESFRTLDYFDPLTLVPRLRAPAIVSAGGKDHVCPPETIRTVFDRIAGVKSLVYDPDLIHTSSIDFYRAGWQWIERHLSE